MQQHQHLASPSARAAWTGQSLPALSASKSNIDGHGPTEYWFVGGKTFA